MNVSISGTSTPSEWFKSSYSNGSGGECVECSQTTDGTLIRDSKHPEGPVLAVQAKAWSAFIEGACSIRCAGTVAAP
ncbi:DUF397 domain-containing protein [Streptomyces zaomyceticus]|uniref:DUF397 domain-containing protein n=1 Tax=Streptomyces zaomyceticus TaxID=68286 RepID=UPI002E1CFA82